ncbi:PAS domain-containing protein, partial [Thiocapsa roseopersicina]
MSTVAGDGGSSGENVRNDAMAFERAEDALAQSEAKYRCLFESIDEGFCIIEMLFDARDKPVDYRFLEVNAAFERQSGLLGAVSAVSDFDGFAIKLRDRGRRSAPPVSRGRGVG